MTPATRTLRGVEPPNEGPMGIFLLLSAALAVYLLVALWWPEKF